jgi:pteridine reductase
VSGSVTLGAARPRVLVTGGGVRLGRAMALGFAGAGCDVAVHYNRSAGPAHEVVVAVEALGGRAVALPANLRDPSACAPLVGAAVAALGGLDVLINSAADYGAAAFATLTLEDWERTHALNLRAPFLLTQAALPALRASARPGGGCVLNLTDIAARRPAPGFAHYCAAKAGLDMLTRSMALELAPLVRVNAIAPGTVMAPEGMDEATLEGIRRTIPLGRFGRPGDIMEAALFLALRAPYVTGQTLAVDGGREVGGPMEAG